MSFQIIKGEAVSLIVNDEGYSGLGIFQNLANLQNLVGQLSNSFSSDPSNGFLKNSLQVGLPIVLIFRTELYQFPLSPG